MDRFIDLDYTSSVKNQLSLKSNMDRFIDPIYLIGF